MLSSYVTINSRPKYTVNRTGFGYMVYDIAKSIAKTQQVDMLLSDTRDEAFTQDGIRFLARSLPLFLRYIFQCISLSVAFRLWRKYRMSRGAAIRLFYYWLISGYYRHVITSGNYDVVHIHGCRFSTELWIELCKQTGTKFIVTLHGLTSFSESISSENAAKQYERDFLARMAKGEIPITVISSGIKRQIEHSFPIDDKARIHVVCNSFSYSAEEEYAIGIRQKYDIPDGARILIYVGNVTVNKNQKAIIDAFPCLPTDIAENTYVLFLGNQLDKNYTIPLLTEGNPYASHLIACGIVEKELTPSFYSQCDGVVLLSITEGFGLSLVEGMHFGKPCLCFDDIDAYNDIFSQDSVVGVSKHDSASVAEGIVKLLTQDWDEEKIRLHSRNFEPEAMARNYINAFKSL